MVDEVGELNEDSDSSSERDALVLFPYDGGPDSEGSLGEEEEIDLTCLMAIRGGDGEEDGAASLGAEQAEDAGRGSEAPETHGHDVLAGPREDDNGIEHPLEQAVRVGVEFV